MTSAREDLSQLTATGRASRLEWLLHSVLELQALITEADFDLDRFMQRVVDLAETLTGARGAVIEIVDGEDMLYRCASTSIREHVGMRLARARSLSGLCVAEGRILRCDDTETDARVNREACRKVGVRSMICMPLFQQGRPVGALKVMGTTPAAFTSNDEYLLGLMAGSLGAALGNQLALKALKTSEETFRTAMETASIGMALVSPNGRFLKVNPALCTLLGYEEADLLVNDFQSITYPEDLEADLALVARTLSGEMDRYRLEKRYYHCSGRIVWVLLSVSLVRNASGQPDFFVAQMQDITEQREIDRLKSEFISIVSHELRTPLTSIRGSLGLLTGAIVQSLPEKARNLLDIARSNSERLLVLINDILDIDKIASGSMRFDMHEHSVAEITTRAAHDNQGYAQKLNVRIEVAPIAPALKISVDEDRYLQVLSNLLSNAAKFSPSGSAVHVRALLMDGQVRISVTDCGDGIPAAFRARIFEKFSQADSSATRRAGGTGLGLHIARTMVEHMQGQIGFESEVGRGTTFWVQFPSQ